jgi:hypothetical protein
MFPLDYLAFVAAGLAGFADVPLVMVVVFSGATFLLLALESSSGRRQHLDWAIAGKAMVGLGQSCLCWGLGIALRAAAGL